MLQSNVDFLKNLMEQNGVQVQRIIAISALEFEDDPSESETFADVTFQHADGLMYDMRFVANDVKFEVVRYEPFV